MSESKQPKIECWGCGIKLRSWVEIGPCPMCADDRDFCNECLRDHLEKCDKDDTEEESEDEASE